MAGVGWIQPPPLGQLSDGILLDEQSGQTQSEPDPHTRQTPSQHQQADQSRKHIPVALIHIGLATYMGSYEAKA